MRLAKCVIIYPLTLCCHFARTRFPGMVKTVTAIAFATWQASWARLTDAVAQAPKSTITIPGIRRHIWLPVSVPVFSMTVFVSFFRAGARLLS